MNRTSLLPQAQNFEVRDTFKDLLPFGVKKELEYVTLQQLRLEGIPEPQVRRNANDSDSETTEQSRMTETDQTTDDQRSVEPLEDDLRNVDSWFLEGDEPVSCKEEIRVFHKTERKCVVNDTGKVFDMTKEAVDEMW